MYLLKIGNLGLGKLKIPAMKKIQPSIVLIVLFLVTTIEIIAQDLPRRGLWQARITAESDGGPGARIRSVEPGSPLANAGFLPGDLITRVNGEQVRDGESWSDIYYGLRSGIPVTLEGQREGAGLSARVTFAGPAKEVHEDMDTFYESVYTRYGIKQRTIITRPKKPGRQPAILILDGLSCSSIELLEGSSGNWARTLKDLVEKSGMVVMRIEKPGVGDSEGDCGSADFLTDLSGYEAAVLSLKSKPYVDPDKIIVYGSSMGSALAPYIANKHELAGIISDGTFFKTWFEHMLEIERRIRQFEGDSESEILHKLNTYYIPLYYGMLIEKKSYREMVNKYPALKAYNYHGPEHMYGRPMAYYHQLQDFDLAGEWEKVNVPVRILRGTNDWIMSAEDNHMIIDVLEANGHSDHLLFEYPGLDHWNTIHASAKDSYKGEPGTWDGETVNLIISWAREIVGSGS